MTLCVYYYSCQGVNLCNVVTSDTFLYVHNVVCKLSYTMTLIHK